jgi:hypothetical protein
VSVSWGDHLSFGDGDGRLDTPDNCSVVCRCGAMSLVPGSVHWRMLRSRIAGTYSGAPGYRHPSDTAAKTLDWDDFAIVPAMAREEGSRRGST